MYRLTSRQPDTEPGPPVEVEVVPFLIGRVPEADLVLTESTVSGRHAQIEVHPDGRVVLRDLGSTNGTWVDGRKIDGGVWLPVPGSFRIGSTTLTLEGAEPVPGDAIAPPASGDETVVSAPVPALVATPPPAAALTPAPPAPAAAPAPAWGAPAPVPAAAAPGPAWGAAQAQGPGSPPATPQPSVAAQAGTAAAEPMPELLPRGLVALIIAGVLQILEGILVAALAQSDEVDPELVPALLVVAAISLVAGGVETGLAVLAWRRNGYAAAFLVAVAIGLTLLALGDTIAVIENDGNIVLPALRLSLNGFGVIAVLIHRRWFDQRARRT